MEHVMGRRDHGSRTEADAADHEAHYSVDPWDDYDDRPDPADLDDPRDRR